ncbi:MAG TPA: Rne/Rng family ribonuclease, partial [Brevibacterium sp.]|nr:Rne/Rng family ribonuclease [Brevibacterium sp.]
DGEGRSRSRRRRGGRGRRSRSRERSEDADSGSDEDGSREDEARSRASQSDRHHEDADHAEDAAEGTATSDEDPAASGDDERSGSARRGSRRGRRRRSSGDEGQSRSGTAGDGGSSEQPAEADGEDRGSSKGDQDGSEDDSASSRRRRRRRGRTSRREGGGSSGGESTGDDQVTAIKGSTRLEAKRQRRREGREAGRRRPLLTEAEFLARRESVSRTMLVREQEGRTQLVVLEDGIAVEHYLSEHKAQASLIGNVYLGRVQNVLPSMEAAFIDIGKGRNAVLYAGEVNWDALGMSGKPHRIEQALSAGDPVLVQVTKDPVGHKGARLTSQISLPGRFLVYIPGNSMTGISRKLPDNERARLKKLLKEILPDQAGVIVRTASEGASDDELRRDVERLTKRWDSIQKKSKAPKAPSPKLLYSEPDMIVRIIRDVFNEDFDALVVDGEGVWDTIHEYVEAVAPDLLERVSRYGTEGTDTADAGAAGTDIFDHFRVNEQVEKALHRKVNLPSGGSLVIDRTEAMTVVDVNTGKFTGSGGNLEETVTKNNLEAADEVIRQLRLRDIGGIIVVDFIDMVLESNRDLVTRRLVECLARDRTRHQVAEVTSLGLVQMTRKRIGTGLAESLAAAGEDLSGRGLLLPGSDEKDSGSGQKGGQRGRRQGKGGDGGSSRGSKRQPSAQDDERDLEEKNSQSRSAVAAIAKATLKKSDDSAGGGTNGESPQDATADRPTRSTDPSDEQAESASEGRRPRRGGGRSRGSSRSTEAPQGTRQSAPPPPEPTGPMPLMIGAESATTVQTQPTPEPAATTTAPTTDVRPADAQPASAGTSSAEASDEPASADQDAESSAPTGPILMLGMDD